MGGLRQEVDQQFLALVESGNIRYQTQPAAAVGTPMVSDAAAIAWAWAAYVQIVAAAVIPNPCWLCGISIHTGAVETHYGDIAIAIGALAAEVDLAMFHYRAALVGVTANLIAMPQLSETILLPYPIRIAGSPRLAGRVRKDTGASAAGVTLKVILATAVGT